MLLCFRIQTRKNSLEQRDVHSLNFIREQGRIDLCYRPYPAFKFTIFLKRGDTAGLGYILTCI
jgi:hypothetical protein